MADNLDAFMLLTGIKGECLDAQAAKRADKFGGGAATIEVDSISISSSTVDFAPKKSKKNLSAEERDKQRQDEEDENKKGKYTFSVTKCPDMSTPDLFRLYCETAYGTGDRELGRIPKAELWVRKGGKPAVVYLRWELEHVWVTKFDWSVDASGAVTETIDLYPYKMTVYYQAQDSTGAPIVGAKGEASASFNLVKQSDER